MNKTIDVDEFWTAHTVLDKPFKKPRRSLEYIDKRFDMYPLSKDLIGSYRNHDNEVILDYGCGPANDMIGFLLRSNAKLVIGLDVSQTSIQMAMDRLALHKVNNERVQFLQVTDKDPEIPLEDQSVDFVNCLGVLHHTSHPQEILHEFYRIMKPGSKAVLMVYNYDSLWLHLVVAYVRMLREGKYHNLSVHEAFALTTDSESCPISRCWSEREFTEMYTDAGFHGKYLGGYFCKEELQAFAKYNYIAALDESLGNEHRVFLSSLQKDSNDYPVHPTTGLAGFGGVYHIEKRG